MAKKLGSSSGIVALSAFAAGVLVGKIVSATSDPEQKEIVSSKSEGDSRSIPEFDKQTGEPLFV